MIRKLREEKRLMIVHHSFLNAILGSTEVKSWEQTNHDDTAYHIQITFIDGLKRFIHVPDKKEAILFDSLNETVLEKEICNE